MDCFRTAASSRHTLPSQAKPKAIARRHSLLLHCHRRHVGLAPRADEEPVPAEPAASQRPSEAHSDTRTRSGARTPRCQGPAAARRQTDRLSTSEWPRLSRGQRAGLARSHCQREGSQRGPSQGRHVSQERHSQWWDISASLQWIFAWQQYSCQWHTTALLAITATLAAHCQRGCADDHDNYSAQAAGQRAPQWLWSSSSSQAPFFDTAAASGKLCSANCALLDTLSCIAQGGKLSGAESNPDLKWQGTHCREITGQSHVT